MSEDFANNPKSDVSDSSESQSQNAHSEIPENPDQPIEIEGSAHIDAVLEEHELVLIFFYGEWCDYCDLVEPVIQEIAENTWFSVANVDIEANQSFAKSKGVDELPTYLFFKEGELEDRAQGAHDREWFEEWLPLGY